MRLDATHARCEVFTFKEGLLAAVAHDLRIAVTRFTVDIDASAPSIDARFDATSLHVECAVRDGRDAPTLLSARDRAEIDHHLAADILEARRYPEIRFRSTAITVDESGHGVVGLLALHGRERELRFRTRTVDRHAIADLTLRQPDFAIRPYRALLGTLRISEEVRVRFDLTLPA